MKRITAIFKGANGSCGYANGSEYVLDIWIDESGEIKIKRNGTGEPGTMGESGYSNMFTFFDNWTNIKT